MPTNSDRTRKTRTGTSKKKAVSDSSKTSRKDSPKAKKKRRVPLPIKILLILLILLIVAVLAVLCFHAGVTSVRQAASTIMTGTTVPENEYEDESFETSEDGTVSYEDESYYSVMGIDVSSHQGDIDWTALAEEGVEFAILRIGYRGYTAGSLNADEAFASNLAGAQENGIEVGAYFYSQALSTEEALEEAEYVLTLLDGVTLELPVFYDWEMQTAEGSRTQDVDESILTGCAAAFCQTIEEAGYAAGVYFYSSLALDTYDLTQLLEYDFWLSQPGETPDFDYVFTFWQYSYTGSLEGIDGNVDLDLMLVSTGTEEDAAEGSGSEETD